MKKPIAVIMLIIVAAFTALLSGCSIGSTEDYYLSKSDNPLNVAVVAMSSADGGNYEIQIGILTGSEDDARLAVSVAGGAINSILAPYDLQAKYESNLQPYSGRIIYDSSMLFYCFSVEAPFDIEHIDSDFGFFNIRHRYELKVGEWTQKLNAEFLTAAAAYAESNAMRNVFASYTQDDKAFALCAVVNNSLESESARTIYKNTTYGILSCLCYVGEQTYSCNAERMASGWYVFPIILGAAVVVIIIAKTRKNKKNNDVTLEEVLNYSSEQDDVSQEENEVEIDLTDAVNDSKNNRDDF